eukprot:5661662-Pleurochrysis_carterae.AAC.1
MPVSFKAMRHRCDGPHAGQSCTACSNAYGCAVRALSQDARFRATFRAQTCAFARTAFALFKASTAARCSGFEAIF